MSLIRSVIDHRLIGHAFLSKYRKGGLRMPLPDIALKRIDHLRLVVGNARQSAYFYRNAFGFDVVAYAGLETGVRDQAGYVLRQGEIAFVLDSPLRADHPDNARLALHGDGVK